MHIYASMYVSYGARYLSLLHGRNCIGEAEFVSYRQARRTPEECRRRPRRSHIPEAYLQVRHRPTPSSVLDSPLRNVKLSRSRAARCDTYVHSDSCARDIYAYIHTCSKFRIPGNVRAYIRSGVVGGVGTSRASRSSAASPARSGLRMAKT